MPNRFAVNRHDGQLHVGSLDAAQITRRDRPAARGPSRQVLQFNIQNRTLKTIHAKIKAHRGVGVAFR